MIIRNVKNWPGPARPCRWMGVAYLLALTGGLILFGAYALERWEA